MRILLERDYTPDMIQTARITINDIRLMIVFDDSITIVNGEDMTKTIIKFTDEGNFVLPQGGVFTSLRVTK